MSSFFRDFLRIYKVSGIQRRDRSQTTVILKNIRLKNNEKGRVVHFPLNKKPIQRGQNVFWIVTSLNTTIYNPELGARELPVVRSELKKVVLGFEKEICFFLLWGQEQERSREEFWIRTCISPKWDCDLVFADRPGPQA
ncbi:hypothetical protein AVEN_100429-1 [Araneus ventricosus]|uniref:Uncharacterized protein n=1 Tax=Araneus ventricosus TaxID=182803 RepID=A0A4Y2CZI5_ARAVE|nr:hypothetical protein AVEN_100429-1 [Araneus ventricosus]